MMIVLGSDEFAEKLARDLSADHVAIEKTIFPDGESRPRILGELDKHVVLAERMSVPTDPNRYLVETLLTLRNLKAGGVEEIDVVMPYFVYAKQDKIFRPGEPYSAKHVLELLEQAGTSRFFTVSSHAERDSETLSLTKMPAYNINGFEAIGEYLKKLNLNNPIVVGADMGVNLSTKTVSGIIAAEKTSLKKERDLDTGSIVMHGEMNAKNRDIVIIDDMISSGGTMIKAIEIAKKSGAEKIISAVVHPVLAKGAYEKISPMVWKFLATDTIDSPISAISVTGKLAEKIQD
jgi:ribose-phosphate pyrophosphokinase